LEKVSENFRKFEKIAREKNAECVFSTHTDASRSRKMLKNAYLDAKIGFDTEENEPSKVLY